MKEEKFKPVPVDVSDIINYKRKNGENVRMTDLPTDYFMYRPKLYRKLALPSYVHGYSLAIQYMRDWFKSKFPKNYFKTIYINGKHVLSDWKQFNNYNIKREKPMLSIVPTVDFDYDRERLDLYQGDTTLFLRTSNYEQSFFRDYENKQFLYVRPRALKMNFGFRVRLNTRSEQLDQYNRMELAFRIGSTQHSRCSVDFHIPDECIIALAKNVGFDLVLNADNVLCLQKGDICELVNYLNKHSDLPIIYKYRGINQKPGFFMRMDNLYTHISCLDKLQMNDGDQVGKLYDNFDIEMTAILTIPVPHFFVLFDQEYKNTKMEIHDNADEYMSLYTINPFQIPPTNENGWNQFALTSYMTDKDESFIDVTSILEGGGNITKVLDYTIKSGISPRLFMDIRVYLEAADDESKEVPIEIDYEKKYIYIQQPYHEEKVLELAFYVDMKYVNDTIINMENLIPNNRIKDQHID